MYRWLLCFRYLRTRYIALASIISVTLGVATMVVVNSVMSGFSAEMHERLHGVASDILIQSRSAGGMPDPELHLAEIRKVCGEKIAGASVSVTVPAMLGIDYRGDLITRPVSLVGIDSETYNDVSEFGRYLLHPSNQRHVGFELREDGYAPDRDNFPTSGWRYRRARVQFERAEAEQARLLASLSEREDGRAAANDDAANDDAANDDAAKDDVANDDAANDDAAGPSMGMLTPADLATDQSQTFDPAVEQFPGLILGISTCSTRLRDADNNVRDHYYSQPGDDVRLMFPNAADNTKVVNQRFTVVDLYESGMSEYDSTFAFCRLDQLQEFRGMIDPQTGTRSVTTIQLKLVEGVSLNAVRDLLRKRFPPQYAYEINTWRDLQGPLLAAVRLETMILNILLFLIIAVAGFGILATFFMIVVEKTRDIGTLKALGASGGGVMSIFVSYGLLLGIVGSGAGLVGGLLFVARINDIAALIEKATGQEVFDPTVYYFTEIPTIVEPFTLMWVTAGAIAIAVFASVLPAIRAARMHPVSALRFE